MAEVSLERGITILRGRSRVIQVMLWTYIGTSVLLLVAWGGVIGFGIPQHNASQHPLLISAGLVSITYLFMSIACIIGVSMWIHRAHANLFAAGFEGLEFTPGWSVGWFFVPVACLFKPFQAMRELWNSSHLQEDGFSAPAPRMLSLWWGFWIVGSIVGNLGVNLSGISGAMTAFNLIAYILRIVAAWLLIRIVADVTEAQTSQMTAAYAFA